MKLGNGKNKYTIKFKYSKTGRVAIKNVYADDLMEARILFNKEYRDYEVEIIDWNWRTNSDDR